MSSDDNAGRNLKWLLSNLLITTTISFESNLICICNSVNIVINSTSNLHFLRAVNLRDLPIVAQYNNAFGNTYIWVLNPGEKKEIVKENRIMCWGISNGLIMDLALNLELF